MAWSGSVKPAWRKARQASTFRKHTSAQHAHFLSRLSAADPISLGNDTDNPQATFDHLYNELQTILDKFYPQRTVTITSADPPYITPAVKHMLRRKNKLMRANRIEEANALACKIGIAIKQFNTAELSRCVGRPTIPLDKGSPAHRAQ